MKIFSEWEIRCRFLYYNIFFLLLVLLFLRSLEKSVANIRTSHTIRVSKWKSWVLETYFRAWDARKFTTKYIFWLLFGELFEFLWFSVIPAADAATTNVKVSYAVFYAVMAISKPYCTQNTFIHCYMKERNLIGESSSKWSKNKNSCKCQSSRNVDVKASENFNQFLRYNAVEKPRARMEKLQHVLRKNKHVYIYIYSPAKINYYVFNYKPTAHHHLFEVRNKVPNWRKWRRCWTFTLDKQHDVELDRKA